MSIIRTAETVYWWSDKPNTPEHVVCDDCMRDHVHEAMRKGLTIVVRGVTIVKGWEGTLFIHETEGTATPCEASLTISGWDCCNTEPVWE